MERSAFEQKARTWREKALNVSRHYGAGEDMAEDIAQDVMLRLWQMHDELERFRSVEAIVTLMAKHTLRDLQRRRTAESLEEATIVSLTSSPQEELEAKENEEWLIMKLQQLPTTQRTLLYMRQEERRSHEEIAQLLGIEMTWLVIKNVKILQKFGVYQSCFIENTYICKSNLIKLHNTY